MKIYIYGLFDPRTPDKIRYVGQTQSPVKRHMDHCRQTKAKTARSKWVENLKSEGFMPSMRILEETTSEQANEREMFWLRTFPREQLVSNATNGCGNRHEVAGPLTPLADMVAEFERGIILKTLEANKWRVSHSAKQLCVSRPTLYERMEKYGFKKPKPIS